MQKYTHKRLLYLFFYMTLAFAPLHAKEANLQAQKGILDLRSTNITHFGGIPLNGEWAFWWQQFIDPSSESRPQPDTFIKSKKSWTNILLNNKKVSSKGWASYHLKILVDPDEQSLGVKIGAIDSNYELYANGVLIAAAGNPGIKKKESIPQYKAQICDFIVPTNGIIDLVLHVSNFNTLRGGIIDPITLGNYSDLIYLVKKEYSITTFIIGSLLMIGAYLSLHFLLRKKEWTSLFMALFCFAVAIRVFFLNSILVSDVFPSLNFNWLLKIKQIVIFLAAAAIANLYQGLFSQEIRHKHLKQFTRLSLGLSIVMIIFPSNIFSYTKIVFFLFVLIVCTYVFRGLLAAIKHKRQGAPLSLFSFCVLVFIYVNDFLNASGVIQTKYLTSTLINFFVLCQSAVLASRFSRAFSRAESLSLDLEIFNSELEAQVQERTSELQKALIQIKEISLHDSLTNCFNRHFMEDQFPVEIERALRYHRSLSIIIGDIDNFKKINDTYGHQTGDRVLSFIGKACKTALRERIDIIIRYGGEEFLFILPETSFTDACKVAERMRQYIEYNSRLPENTGIPVTISFGVTGTDPQFWQSLGLKKHTESHSPNAQLVNAIQESLIKQADANLYKAKNEGRNKVVGSILEFS